MTYTNKVEKLVKKKAIHKNKIRIEKKDEKDIKDRKDMSYSNKDSNI